MASSSKPGRGKLATRKVQPRLPKDRATLRHAHSALYSFAEQLRGEIDSALTNVKSRRLTAARYVEEICRYVLHRQGTAQSKAWHKAPTDVEINADLAAGLLFVDWDELAAQVKAWSGTVAQLAAYEGKAYKRKRLLLGQRGHADHSVEKRDAEREALATLEQQAASLIAVFQDAAGVLEQRLEAASAKRKRTNNRTTDKLSVTEVAKRLRVSPEKVRTWIDDEELPATNVASASSTRARWRIDPKDLEAFELTRQPTKPSPPSTRKRRKKFPDTKEYF